MRYLSWTFRLLLFVLLFGFALKNADPVTVRFYLGTHWEASLALVVLVFFAIGIGVGVIGCFAYIFRQRREILQLRKELRARPGAPLDAHRIDAGAARPDPGSGLKHGI